MEVDVVTPVNPVVEKMQKELARYHALRQHDASQLTFRERLYTVQRWQSEMMRQTHKCLLEDSRYRPATEFFLQEIYGGNDHSQLARNIERAMHAAIRVLPARVMETSNMALEFNAIGAELDEALTVVLYEEMGVLEITTENYVKAFRRCGNRKARERQIELARQLAGCLDKYVKNRALYVTFRLLKKPARMAGIDKLYQFTAKGFEVMRPVKNVGEFINRLVDRETRVIDNIFAGSLDPFG